MPDYRAYHQQESFIYDTIGPRFRAGKPVSTHDFFCIVIWKANRAKSKEYRRLVDKRKSEYETIDTVVARLIGELQKIQGKPREMLDLMLSDAYGFRLPMATAILSVFDPDNFTIYDYRVIEQLKLSPIASFNKDTDERWAQYQEYVKRVQGVIEEQKLDPPTLRSADQWLWGKSFHDQLHSDLEKGFPKEPKKKKKEKER